MTGDVATVVAFHAHPDDEALLTGGTLASLAADGHRVVLVTATAGGAGLAGKADGTGAELAAVRTVELHRSAEALGCQRVQMLGLGDSGLHPDPDDGAAFVHVPVDQSAAMLAEVLREEDADVLLTYDPHGGYGHPDHVQAHRVAYRAAEVAGTPVVLEATVPAGLFRAGLRLLGAVGHALGRSAPLGTTDVFVPGAEITHRVDVRRSIEQKRAAMAAHGSQRRAEGEVRMLDRALRLPTPLFGLVFGREWFVQRGVPARPRRRSVLDGLDHST